MSASRPRRILSIQSEVVAGHVGNSAARFALQRLGFDVLALPTVLFSNHPGHGGFRGRATEPSVLKELLDGLDERGLLRGVDAVLSGYLGSPDHAEIVRDAVRRVHAQNETALYALDPVFGDDHGAYARPGVAEAMAELLLPLAKIVTPNRFELATLSGRPFDDRGSVIDAARSLARPIVLATSVPCGPDRIGTACITPDEAWLAETDRMDDPPSGTGDLLSALFLAGHLAERSIPETLGRNAASLDRLIRVSQGRKDIDLIAHQKLLIDGARLPVVPFS